MSSDKLPFAPGSREAIRVLCVNVRTRVVHISASTHRKKFRASFGSVVMYAEKMWLPRITSGARETLKKNSKNPPEWKKTTGFCRGGKASSACQCNLVPLEVGQGGGEQVAARDHCITHCWNVDERKDRIMEQTRLQHAQRKKKLDILSRSVSSGCQCVHGKQRSMKKRQQNGSRQAV